MFHFPEQLFSFDCFLQGDLGRCFNGGYDQFAVHLINVQGIPLLDVALEQLFGEAVFDMLLNRPAERTGTEGRIIALFGKECFGAVSEQEIYIVLTQTLAQAPRTSESRSLRYASHPASGRQ